MQGGHLSNIFDLFIVLGFSFFLPTCGKGSLLGFVVCMCAHVCVCLPSVWLQQECKSTVLPVL